MPLLVMALMPTILFAQLNQTQQVIKQTQQDKYPGGVYARWDSVSKKYNWYSYREDNRIIEGGIKQFENTANVVDAYAGNLFHLVKDINDATHSTPGNYHPQFYYQHYAVLNGVAYFAADDGIHGSELWRSDGTNAGTYLLKDIEPGATSSGVSNITAANGKIYLSATTTANGAQPWISDGTSDGTVILKDISASATGYPEMFTAVKNKVYFFTGRTALWVTDGTETGTTMLFNNTWEADNLAQPVAVGNKLFFTASSYNYGSRQLWRSDGTVAGTFIPKVGSLYYYQGDPQQLTAYKGKLYFSMWDDNSYSRNIWISDGTENGTNPIYNNNNVSLPYYDGVGGDVADVPFVLVNGTFYFVGSDNWTGTGIEIFKYNPETADGILLVKDITPGWEGSNIQPFDITAFKDNLYFKVINTDGSAALWRSNGDDAGTKAIKQFASPRQYTFYDMYSTPNSLFFEAYTTAKGFELWKSDGTNAGTQIAADVSPGIYSSYPYNYTVLGQGLLFSASNKSGGKELWGMNGASVTKLVKDINTTTSESSYLYDITPVPGGVMFSAYNLVNGNEPFFSDGTVANTMAAADVFPGDLSSYPYAFKMVGDVVYFMVNYDENNLPALYKYTVSTKQLVKLFEAPIDYYLLENYAVTNNGLIIFQMRSIYGQQEFWRTDGTVTGSFMLRQSSYYYSGPGNEMIAQGNTVYLSFNDPYYGTELYKTDGTVNGTKIVNDLYAGSSGSYPYSYFVYNGTVYFAAGDEDNQTYLWKTDGTYGGTKKIKAIPVAHTEYGDKDMSRVYCISNGLLFIHAHASYYGEVALWRSDGTTAGTKLVRTINLNAYSGINNLTDVNSTVYFSADDGVNGNELWASNGTMVGTILVKDITAGFGSSNLNSLCVANGTLYFLNEGTLWQSNGPGNKTKAVNDAGLAGVSSLRNLAASGSMLFVDGYTQEKGDELYVADVSLQLTTAKQAQNIAVKKEADKITATISPNPVHDVATLQLVNAKQASIMLVDNNGKLLWQQNSVSKTQLAIPMQQYPAGIYFIKISSDGKEQSLQLFKE